ncbi:MAG TPA: NUDIX hydrolase [Lachnospiraceae bacterium]|nr:NUDIX hydrolase [Lachnospiraceae bacterium]
MKLLGMRKIANGKYLKNYQLTYENRDGREKVYEIVSRNDMEQPDQLGCKLSGVSIVAFCEDKLLLLKEFRMGVNKEIYNLCAGFIEPNETMDECMKRELYEETGLSVKRIIDVLNPCYSAVAISDIKTCIAFVEVEGTIASHTSANEEIAAALYSREEVKELLKTEEFSSRAQMAAYYFALNGPFHKTLAW